MSFASAKSPTAKLLRLLLVVLVVSVTGATTARSEDAAAEKQSDESWQVIYIGPQRVGYARTELDSLDRDGQTVVRAHAETHLTIKRFGQTLKMSTDLVTEETPDGDLLGFEFEMQNPPASSTQTKGRVDGKRLVLESVTDGRRQKKALPWDRSIKSPVYQERLLREEPLAPGETRSYKAFLPEFEQVATVTIAVDDKESVELLDGARRELLRTRVTQSIVPNLVTKAWLDTEGETLKTSTNMLGTEMLTYTVSQDKALEAIVGEELDLAVTSLIEVPPIENAHQTKRVVYEIRIAGDDPAKHIPAGGTQQIQRRENGRIDLIVTAAPLPASAGVEPSDEFAEYLGPTRLLQADDEQVQAHARRAAADATDPAQISRRMEKYVHDELTEKNFSTALASASEVARNLEGDCTEHAVLLAAMLRAKQIPSRVAVGLVYVPGLSSFGGHMWTEAALGGDWIPLDATLGQGGIGAAHIKLGDSSFSNDGPNPAAAFAPLMSILGNLEITVKSAE